MYARRAEPSTVRCTDCSRSRNATCCKSGRNPGLIPSTLFGRGRPPAEPFAAMMSLHVFIVRHVVPASLRALSVQDTLSGIVGSVRSTIEPAP